MTEPVHNVVTESPPLTVLYDGGCPVCRREIGMYRRLQPLRPDLPVCFADVSDAAFPLPSALPPGTTREQLLARFHVRGRDGRVLSGAQAFLALWSALPGWRWLALAGRAPGAAWVMERFYLFFLRWRPALQRWVFRLVPSAPDRSKSQDDATR
jgi:predicted DCC family thiol-disulfide oxidoreductase YuxK